MDVIKVSAHSRSTAVAGAIAGVMRDHGHAEVQAIGASAVNQAIKAVAIARELPGAGWDRDRLLPGVRRDRHRRQGAHGGQAGRRAAKLNSGAALAGGIAERFFTPRPRHRRLNHTAENAEVSGSFSTLSAVWFRAGELSATRAPIAACGCVSSGRERDSRADPSWTTESDSKGSPEAPQLPLLLGLVVVPLGSREKRAGVRCSAACSGRKPVRAPACPPLPGVVRPFHQHRRRSSPARAPA